MALPRQLVVGCLPLHRAASLVSRFLVGLADKGDLVSGLLPRLILGDAACVDSLEVEGFG